MDSTTDKYKFVGKASNWLDKIDSHGDDSDGSDPASDDESDTEEVEPWLDSISNDLTEADPTNPTSTSV